MKTADRKPGRRETESVLLREGHYVMTNLETEDERVQAYRLRYSVFSQELQWVACAENMLEKDEFDDGAIFFGVYDEQKNLIAFLRLILSQNPFMLERIFPSLLKSEREFRKDRETAELSRLCIASRERGTILKSEFGGYTIAEFLYKGVYQWCRRNEIRYVYFVIAYELYRLMRGQGFPCRKIGEPTRMPDRITALSARMDWKEFEMTNAEKRPRLLRWFNRE